MSASVAREHTNLMFGIDLPGHLREHFEGHLATETGLELVFPASQEEDELLKHAPHADVLVAWRVPPTVLEAATKLKLYIFPGVGVQNLIEPFRALNEQRRITLANCHGNTCSAAQHAVALMLALTNHLVRYHSYMLAGRWRVADEEGGVNLVLRDQTVGLLGYGAINQKVHKHLQSFGVRFAILRKHWDKQREPLLTEALRFSENELAPFLEATDILIIGLPQTSRTLGLIGADELKLLGESSLLVNVARGSIVDEEALYHALEDGVIAGAALDVWYEYRPEPDEQGRLYPYHFPFHGLDNVVLSPHRAASPVYAPDRWEEVVENILHFHQGEPLINVVDLTEEY